MKEYNLVKGATNIILSAFFFALMGMFVKLAGDVPSFQKAFFRNVIAAFIALFILLKNGDTLKWTKGCFKALSFRAIFGFMGVILNFYAIDKLNLSDALALNKISPFFAVVASLVILKEKTNIKQLSIIAMAFIGSLFIIKPTEQLFNIASLYGLMGGLCAGVAYAFVRQLSNQGERGTYIVFFFSAFSTLVLLPNLIFNYTPMSLMQFVFLILAGVCASLGQFTITAAYGYAPAKDVSVYDYTQMIFSTILGFIFFGELPDILSFVGYGIILAAAIIMYLYNKKYI